MSHADTLIDAVLEGKAPEDILTEVNSEDRKVGKYIIHKTNIIGTNEWVYSAYEPYDGHSTIFNIGGKKMGSVPSRPLPVDLEALPAYSKERSVAVRKWHDDLYKLAYQLIFKAFPEAKNGKTDMGEVSLWMR